MPCQRADAGLWLFVTVSSWHKRCCGSEPSWDSKDLGLGWCGWACGENETGVWHPDSKRSHGSVEINEGWVMALVYKCTCFGFRHKSAVVLVVQLPFFRFWYLERVLISYHLFDSKKFQIFDCGSWIWICLNVPWPLYVYEMNGIICASHMNE